MKYLIAFLAFNLIHLISYGMEPEKIGLSKITESANDAVTITTSDGKELKIARALLKTIPTIRALIEDCAGHEAITLTITEFSLTKILGLLGLLEHQEMQKITDELKALSQDQLITFIKDTNYLGLTDLLDIVLEVFSEKINAIKDIEPYIGHAILPADIGRRMLEMSGASSFFLYKSALTLPCLLSIPAECLGYNATKKRGKMLSARYIIKSLHITPDNSCLIIEDIFKKIHLYDLKGICLHRFFEVSQVCFSNAKPLIAMNFNLTPCFGANNLEIATINNGSRTPIIKPISFGKYLNEIIPYCFSPDGSKLVLINKLDNSKIHILNVENQTSIDCKIQNYQLMPPIVRITDDNAHLVVYNGASIDWYHVATGDRYQSFEIKKPTNITNSFASSDGSVIALCNFNKIYFYNFEDGTLINLITDTQGEENYLLMGALNHDGSVAAITGYTDPAIRFYDVRSGKLIRCLKEKELLACNNYFAPEFALNGALLRIVATDATGTFKEFLWDVKSGQCVHYLKDVYHFNLSGDSRLMAGCKDSLICIWSVDKNLENYLLKEISIDQALLLFIAFKAYQKNETLIIDKSSKLKTVHNSIAYKGLQATLCDGCIKWTADWASENETKTIAQACEIAGVASANFVGTMDNRTGLVETGNDEPLPKKRKRNESPPKKDENSKIL